MTWTDVVDTGTGGDGVEFRLVVEGCPNIFVSTGEMVGDTVNDASLLPAPGAITWGGATAVTITTGQADPEGGTDAVLLTGTSAVGEDLVRTDFGTYAGPLATRCEIYVKRDTAATNFVGLELRASGPGSGFIAGGVKLHLGTGEVQTHGTGYSDATCVLEGNWWRVRFSNSGLAGTSLAMRVRPSFGFAASYPTTNVAATGDATVYAPVIRAVDGRRRVLGLLREGLGFSESAYLAGAKLDVSISPVRIVETAGADLDAATEAFTAEPTTVAWLTASLTASATSASVSSAADITDESFYHLGTEVIKVTDISGTTLTIERGKWDTTGQAHPLEATDGTPTIRAVRSAPSTWQNRRAWLYAHGADELDVLDAGTVIWRGVVMSDPQLDGGDATTWVVNLGSRWELLDQEVAAGNDKTRRISGVYYPGTRALWIGVQWGADATFGGSITNNVTKRIAGFFGSTSGISANLAWARHVADTLNNDADINAAGFVFTGMVDDDGRWTLHVTVPTPAIYPEIIGGGSPVDGSPRGSVRGLLHPEGQEVWTVTAGTTYQVNWFAPFEDIGVPSSELRREPRTMNGGVPEVRSDTDADVTTYSDRDVYLDSVRGLEANSTLTISQPPDVDGNEREPYGYNVSSVTAATGKVRLAGTPMLVVAGDYTREITVTTRLVPHPGGTLADLRDELISDAPDLANAGARPMVTADDLADWHTVIDPIVQALPSVYDRRSYVYDQGVRLGEVLEQEAAFYGCFFRLNSDAKIDVRPLTFDTQPVAATHTLSDEDGTILSVDGFGTLTTGDDGNVNVVEYGRAYDPKEDKHGSTIRVRSVEGMSEARKERAIEIKPKSTGRAEINSDRAQALAAPILAFFGGRIHHYTFAVPLTRFGVLVGDKVEITCGALPWGGARRVNTSGSGLSSVVGIVVGRDWSDIASGVGRLTVLVSSRMTEVAGYSPSGRVSSASGATTSWTLTLEANRYSPTGEVDASYFAVDDLIQLTEWDAASPTTRTGQVTAVSGNDVSVTLDSSWTGLGGAVYVLTYEPASASHAASQFQYAFIAGSDRRITVPAGVSAQARTFAP